MRQIKFRGKVLSSLKSNRDVAYGSLVIYPEHHHTHWIYTPGADENYPVEPESVSQLIAIDKNGREVYEGDLLNNGQKADISDIHSIELWDLWLEEQS